MAVRSYDAKRVVVAFAGIPLRGFADGTFINAEYNEDLYALKVGADGEATRSRNNNNSGRVTLTLLATSPSNAALSSLFNLDLFTPGAVGTGPLLIKDRSGSTIVSAETAWIVKPPAMEFAREASEREWILETDNLLFFAGSNSTIGGIRDAQEALNLANV